MNRQETTTYIAVIYVAGDQADAERICREFVLRGLCVTVEPVEFIYTGGQERGVRVGLINYPRFPVEPSAIFGTAEELAKTLIEGLHQHSASIVASDKTVWLSRREPDNMTRDADPIHRRDGDEVGVNQASSAATQSAKSQQEGEGA